MNFSSSSAAAPEKFENVVFTLKTHQWFSLPTTPEKFENATISDHLDLSLRNTKPGKSRDYGDAIVYSKRFPSTLKQKASVFKFLHFEECFRKAPFWWRISVDGRPNRRNKAAFSDFSNVERTGSNWLLHWCLPLFLHWVVLTVFFDE